MGPSLRCFLCRTKRGEESLHRIPKNPKIRPSWLAFCKLNEAIDDVSNIHICSRHFSPSDYLQSREEASGSRRILKPNSVPSIYRQKVPVATKTTSCENVNFDIRTEGKPHTSLKRTLDESDPESIKVASSSLSALTENISETTPKKCKFSVVPRYVGDIKTPHFSTPRRAKTCLQMMKKRLYEQTGKIKILQQRNRRLLKRINNLEQLIKHLKGKNLISENTAETVMANMPESMKELITSKLNKKHRKYSPELRRFALTLQFYSTAAYNYVRKVWKNLLPHPSTLRQWYSVVNGKPGFSQEALLAISQRNKISPVNLNIILDEMSIRAQTIYCNGRFYGGIDMGTGLLPENDNFQEATNALVFMAVPLNAHWKIPIGYFLIDGLSGNERANLLTKCLELLHNTGATVFSVTFDGAPVNLSMCASLGTNFNFVGNNFKLWFTNPITKGKVLVFWDPSHMIKLVRNTLGDKKQLIDIDGNLIKWEYLEKLHELQYNEGLHAGTKLTKKHIHFQDNRMNVKLATQTFSESVYNALIFVHQELNIPEFESSMATAKFCLIFNNIFDILNCRNKFSKRNKFNVPIDNNTFGFLLKSAKEFENYIVGLKDKTGIPILQSNRKTGFLGLIICLHNIFELFTMLKDVGQDYLLSYKISQDFLETFFCCIRSRGGFNNNPNAKQFESAYKRLLVRHEISNTYTSNCLADGVEILHVSSQKRNFTDCVIESEELHCDFFDHDYVSTLWTLTPYVENVVKYIAGFIVKKILKTSSICNICSKQLTTENGSIPLIKLKNRGPFVFPSDEVCRICLIAERVFRQNLNVLFNRKNIRDFLIIKILQNISNPFPGKEMQAHILSQDIIDNHRSQLAKLIIELFLKIRLYHEAKTKSAKDINIRQKYTKLILFQHQ